MISDGKPPKTSPETLDDAFFSRASNTGLSAEDVDTAVDREAPTVPHPSGMPVASSADDELSDASDLAPDFDEDAVLGRNRGLHIGGFFLVLVGAIGGGLAGYYALRSTVPAEAPAAIASASASAKVVAAPTISAPAPATVGSGAASAKAVKAPTSGARTSTKGGDD